ncbi:MAG: ECF-type sigma factor [Planctomycetaceae bacterium]|nr:ECF-type sigma factor [Planctomycetaceae bacterium]
MTDVTRILSQIDSGDPAAAEQLLPLVYDELRKLAAAKLAHEKPGQTLQATALVHEAYLRLVGSQGPGTSSQEPGEANLAPGSRPLAPGSFSSRGHFFAAAAEAMRRILVDQARSKGRQKRGGGRRRIDIDAIDVAIQATPDQLLAIDEALEKLRREDAAVYELVKLRYFAGMNIEQAAAALGISAPTAYRHWNYARAWLHGELLGSAE